MIVLDAPSNLGLRAPAPGVEPGVRRLADALRACGIVERLDAHDAGRVEPPPYLTLGENRAAIPASTRTLAARLGELLDAWPLVLGGDCNLAALRAGGFAAPPAPYWLHLDADVLDLPAVDSPQPGGLSFEELTVLLRRLLPGAVGMQVTVFDPDLDEDGAQARALTNCLVSALAP